MIKNALQILRDRAKVFKQAKYAGVPIQFIPNSQYSDRTANGLTKCIIDWLIFSGHQAERVSNQGRVIDTRKKVVDVVGYTRQIGSVTRIKSSGTNGTSDLSATVNVNGIGRSVKIEVKVGRDVQSEAQRRYQQSIEASGGVYVIATDFESFYNWYVTFVNAAVIKESGGPTP